jgi:hypothetical protein
MAVHVVIVKPRYLRDILDGRKTVECRLSKNAVAPFGEVTTGDRLFIKASGGPFGATALTHRVESFEALTPDGIDRLRQRYDKAIRGAPAFWRAKQDARYATLVTLGAVEPIDVGPPYRKSPYKGWFVLSDRYNPLMDVPITDGALRNRYLRLPAASNQMRGQSVVLYLPDGTSVTTQLQQNGLIRWRGWGRYYKAHALQPGDRVRLIALGQRCYRVIFNPKQDR